MTSLLTEEVLFKKSPQEITALLYEGLMDSLEDAIAAIKKKDLYSANQKLKKSNDIIYRLDAGINYQAGIIADQLDALYDYMSEKLIEANINKDISAIEEVLNIVKEIAITWNQSIRSKNVNKAPNFMRQKSNAYEQHILTID